MSTPERRYLAHMRDHEVCAVPELVDGEERWGVYRGRGRVGTLKTCNEDAAMVLAKVRLSPARIKKLVWAGEAAPTIIQPNNCAILDKGRCWYFLSEDDVCPVHGDVSHEMHKYRRFGVLTSCTERSS